MKRSDIKDEEIYKAIRKYRADSPSRGFVPDYLLQYPEKVVLAKMSQIVKQGKLEYGVSLRTAWIVEETKEKQPS